MEVVELADWHTEVASGGEATNIGLCDDDRHLHDDGQATSACYGQQQFMSGKHPMRKSWYCEMARDGWPSVGLRPNEAPRKCVSAGRGKRPPLRRY